MPKKRAKRPHIPDSIPELGFSQQESLEETPFTVGMPLAEQIRSYEATMAWLRAQEADASEPDAPRSRLPYSIAAGIVGVLGLVWIGVSLLPSDHDRVAAPSLPSPPLADGSFFLAPATASPPGDDRNPCTFDAPCLTLHRASGRMNPGDTLYLRGGTYGGGQKPLMAITPSFPSGTSWDHPTRVAAYPEERVVLQGRPPILVTSEARHIVFERLILKGDASEVSPKTQGLVIADETGPILLTNGVLRNATTP